MSRLQPGDRIGNYLLDELIGTGGFGEVWKGRHHVFQDAVAIKVPTDTQYVKNLQKEGAAVHGLRHQNVVRAIGLEKSYEIEEQTVERAKSPARAKRKPAKGAASG